MTAWPCTACRGDTSSLLHLVQQGHQDADALGMLSAGPERAVKQEQLQKWIQCSKCNKWRKVRDDGREAGQQGWAPWPGVHATPAACMTCMRSSRSSPAGSGMAQEQCHTGARCPHWRSLCRLDSFDVPATRLPHAAAYSCALFSALQVPYTLLDEDIPDIWECRDNQWDAAYASCETAQALTDAAIDSILAGQQDIEAELLPLIAPVLDDNDEPYEDDG